MIDIKNYLINQLTGREPRTDPLDPYRACISAIILQALMDLRSCRERDSAWAWIKTMEHKYSCEYYCNLLELEHEAVLDKAKQLYCKD